MDVMRKFGVPGQNPSFLDADGIQPGHGGVTVRNTFLEVQDDEDDDPWLIGAGKMPLRQHTDSVLERPSLQLRRHDLENSILAMLQNRLHLDSSSGPPGLTDGDLFDEALLLPDELGSDVSEEHAAQLYSGQMCEGAEEVEEDCGPSAQEKEVDPAIQAMRDVAAAGGGLGGCTTVMVRHLPCKYTQRKLMREFNDAGFLGRYDVFYLPMDSRSRANRGFAFINFVNADIADQFYCKFHGQHLNDYASEELIAVMPADLQGFEANAVHYAEARAFRKQHHLKQNKPLFFRPLPDNLVGSTSVEVHVDQQDYAYSNGPNGSRAGGYKSGYIAKSQMNLVAGSPVAPRHYNRQNPVALNTNGKASGKGMCSNGFAQASTTGQPQVPRFCGFCGNPRLPQHLFCTHCGGRF